MALSEHTAAFQLHGSEFITICFPHGAVASPSPPPPQRVPGGVKLTVNLEPGLIFPVFLERWLPPGGACGGANAQETGFKWRYSQVELMLQLKELPGPPGASKISEFLSTVGTLGHERHVSSGCWVSGWGTPGS